MRDARTGRIAKVRTTLDLDPRLLAAARARAHERKISLGLAVSELGLRGLAAEQPVTGDTGQGLVMLPVATDPSVITDQMVADALAED